MGINYHKHLMEFFKNNQAVIMDTENKDSYAQIYKPIEIKATPKTTGMVDILFQFNDQLYLAKCVKIAHTTDLFPLNFEDSFILRYHQTTEYFKANGHILNEHHVEQDFDYELSNPEGLNRIALGIMTSFPFMDDFLVKFTAQTVNVERNKPCPCGSRIKYKKCCMN